jgi:hypothetical protein
MTSWRQVRRFAAWSGVAVGLLTAGSTYLPGAPYVPDAVWIVLFVLVFPIFGSVVFERGVGRAGRAGRPRRRWNDLSGLTNQYDDGGWDQLRLTLRSLPSALRYGIPVAAIFLFASMMFGIASLQGQPEIHNGRYFLDDHGSLIPVDHAGYEHGRALQERLFVSGATLFLGFAAMLTTWPVPTDGRDGRVP